MSDYDIDFFFDPVCPFAWITSRWVEKVAAQRDYAVDWRFIPLRILNKDKDYATEFPPEYVHGHGAGLRMLRVAAKVRAELGRDQMFPLYTAYGQSIFDIEPERVDEQYARLGSVEHSAEVLAAAGLPTEHATAVDDDSWDAELEGEAEAALTHTGREVGTPIIAFQPPTGPAFFGPVISRIPTDDEALGLWDAVIHLAEFPGFAEMKRSLRESPQLRALGWVPAPRWSNMTGKSAVEAMPSHDAAVPTRSSDLTAGRTPPSTHRARMGPGCSARARRCRSCRPS